ncbi:semaphorin-4C isoform 2-T2 [Cyanocitta cristata]
MAPGRPLALASLLALAAAAATAAATDAGTSWSAVPRRTVPYAELQDAAKRFSQGGVSHYLTLTLDEAEGLLYVGAREAVFALATGTVELKAAISWEAPVEKKAECVQKGKNNQTDCFNYVRFLQSYNSSHLYACGTYAFQPKCTYIELSGFTLDPVAFEDGKGKCPYDPTKGHTGLIVDGELYSATFNNFLGTEPVILRNLGPHYSMKTEYLTSWLNEPHFVASAFVPESAGSGDDDKVYFFFSERAVEYDCYAEQVVARVARVCKGDVGGARTLQKKWTSFLKARLLCSAPEQQLHFNRLQAVFTLPGARWQDTAFFGVFRARWGDVDVSAICRYHILEVRKAFEGPYKEYREQAQKWGRYSGEVPSPRPGACITDWHRQNGFASSLELPDNTLNFAKKHPLMDEPVPPQRGRPLLLKKDANFTQLVVDRVAGLDGATYEVLFIGTGDGWVHKALDLGTHIHLVEELQVFEPAQPVESLALAGTKKLLFAGSRLQVAQLPLADCGRYQSCTDCVLARDPYCAWSRNRSACVRTDGHNGYGAPGAPGTLGTAGAGPGRVRMDFGKGSSPRGCRAWPRGCSRSVWTALPGMPRVGLWGVSAGPGAGSGIPVGPSQVRSLGRGHHEDPPHCALLPQLPPGAGRAELRHRRLLRATGGQARAPHAQERDGGGGHGPGPHVPPGLQPGAGALDLRGPGAGGRAGAGAGRGAAAGAGGAGRGRAAQRHVPLPGRGAGRPPGRPGVPGGRAGGAGGAAGDAGAAGEPGRGVGAGRVPGRPVPAAAAGRAVAVAPAAPGAGQGRQGHREHPGVPHRAAQGAAQPALRVQRRLRLGREALGPFQLLLLGRLAQDRAGPRQHGRQRLLPQRRPRRRVAARRHPRAAAALAHPHPPGPPARLRVQRLHPAGAGRRGAPGLRRPGRGAAAQAAAAPAPARLQPRGVVGVTALPQLGHPGAGTAHPAPGLGTAVSPQRLPWGRGCHPTSAGAHLGDCHAGTGTQLGDRSAVLVAALGTGRSPQCQCPPWGLTRWHRCPPWGQDGHPSAHLGDRSVTPSTGTCAGDGIVTPAVVPTVGTGLSP